MRAVRPWGGSTSATTKKPRARPETRPGGCSSSLICLATGAGTDQAEGVLVADRNYGVNCGSKGESNQLRDTVPTQDDRGEAACDHGEKKGGCDGVFHGKPLKECRSATRPS
jgi:hypothetical protein